MIYEIKTVDGVKTKVPLTGNGYGLPLGTIIAVYSNLVPDGFLPCNGAVYDTTTYAALYAYLGTNKLPDLRECGLVGAGQSSNDYDASTNPNGIHAHDVYAVGEFKDDQFQGHEHNIRDNADADGGGNPRGALGTPNKGSNDTIVRNPVTDGTNGDPRTGTTTHGKQVGVNYCIKATPAYVEPDTVSDMVNTLRTQDSYSTSEVNTGKKWIDGKPIYRKVFDCNISVTDGWTDTGIIDNVIDSIISSTCWGYDIDSRFSTQYFNFQLSCIDKDTSNNHLFINAQNRGTFRQFMVEYTKTTD